MGKEDKKQNDAQNEVNYKDLFEEEKSKRLSLMADFENYRKRLETEKATFGAISNMGLISELLEVSDDLGLALADGNLNLEAAKSSLKHAIDKLVAAAKGAGIEKIDINIGDDFDKEKMEAIQTIPNAEMAGKVIAVISSAYKYSNAEGVLKPGKVIVGK